MIQARCAWIIVLLRGVKVLVIGLMSGTSLDGIDAVLVELVPAATTIELRVIAFRTQSMPADLRRQLEQALPPESGSTALVCALGTALGEVFATAALDLSRAAHVPLEQVDLIASHGQTLYHQVATGVPRSTLQAGAPAIIAERTGRTVIADFRPRDIAAGGQGAPLVPYLDRMLFGNAKRCAVQNIGGMANVTYLALNGSTVAFDTGPGNVLIDEGMRMITGGSQTFDRNGELAAAGTVDQQLLAKWLAHPFFEQTPPKTTGREAWSSTEVRQMLEQAHARGLTDASTIATITALTAHSIANAYHRFLGPVDELIAGGGGARNLTLLRMLSEALPQTTVSTMQVYGIDPDAKEAIAFALLGYATLHGWPNNVPSATGAAHPAVLGSITPGRNYRDLLRKVLSTPAEPPRRIRMG